MTVDASEIETGEPETAPPVVESPSHLLALAKQTIVYGLSGVMLQAVGVVTLPVFARAFTRDEYGVLEIGLVVSAFVLTIVDLGLASAAQRSYYDYPQADSDARKAVVFTALSVTTAVAILAASILAAFSEPLAAWLYGSRDERPFLLAVALAVPLVVLANFLREVMRLRFRAWSYVVASTLAAVVSTVVSVTGVVALDWGISAIFVGVIAGSTLAAVYGIAVVHRDVGRRFSTKELRAMLFYGVPLVPAALSLWGLALLDRVMLGKLADLTEVGEYAVANRVSSLLMLAVTAFALAFGPFIFSIYSEDREKEKIVRAKALTYLTIVLLAGGVALTLFAREAIDVVAPRFDRAYEAVGPLTLGVVAFGISSVVLAGISFARRTVYVAGIAAAAVLVNAVLNLILIPPFGMIGAAVAATAGYTTLAVVQYFVAQRLYPTPYELGKIVRGTAIAVALGSIGLLTLEPLALAFAVKALAFLAFLPALRIAGVVEAADVGKVREFLAGRPPLGAEL